MGERVGPRVDRGLRLGRVDRPSAPSKAGSYLNRERGGGQRGGTVYPSVLEAYNRDSDYQRWRTGLDYWQGSGKSWGDRTEFFLVRPFRDFGCCREGWLTSVTYFPSDGSPEGAWTVGCRRRGALILPQALRADDITITTSIPQVSAHRLILDVSNTLNPDQLTAWESLIGDQFEDSAENTSYPSGIIEEPIDTIAFTLVGVDKEEGKLLFDVSRPFIRRRPSELRPRAFWQQLLYDRRRPLAWRADGSRYLCSSHKLYCSCPDFTGTKVADLSGDNSSIGDRFPTPAAGKPVGSEWESQEVGYKTRWRELPGRADQRRECKHMHALRWSLGYPFYEPSDYRVGSSKQQFYGGSGDSLTSEEILRYHRTRALALDRLAPTLAELSGVRSNGSDSVSFEEGAPVQQGRRPVLWTEDREPEASRCVKDDWWVKRGSAQLQVFNPAVGRFVETKAILSGVVPVLQKVDENDPIIIEPGCIPASIPGNASGTRVTLEIALNAGALAASAQALGASLPVSLELSAVGTATGERNAMVPGASLQVDVTLSSTGEATGSSDASVNGVSIAVDVALTTGSATAGVNGAAPGTEITITTTLRQALPMLWSSRLNTTGAALPTNGGTFGAMRLGADGTNFHVFWFPVVGETGVRVVVVKRLGDGNIAWQRWTSAPFGGFVTTRDSVSPKVLPMSDGGCVVSAQDQSSVGGSTGTPPTRTLRMWRIDGEGNETWTKEYVLNNGGPYDLAANGNDIIVRSVTITKLWVSGDTFNTPGPALLRVNASNGNYVGGRAYRIAASNNTTGDTSRSSNVIILQNGRIVFKAARESMGSTALAQVYFLEVSADLATVHASGGFGNSQLSGSSPYMSGPFVQLPDGGYLSRQDEGFIRFDSSYNIIANYRHRVAITGANNNPYDASLFSDYTMKFDANGNGFGFGYNFVNRIRETGIGIIQFTSNGTAVQYVSEIGNGTGAGEISGTHDIDPDLRYGVAALVRTSFASCSPTALGFNMLQPTSTASTSTAAGSLNTGSCGNTLTTRGWNAPSTSLGTITYPFTKYPITITTGAIALTSESTGSLSMVDSSASLSWTLQRLYV